MDKIKGSEYELTIIVPVYNEEGNMPRLEERLSAYLPKALCRACVLFVDDASTDDSLRLMKEICARQRDFYYLAEEENGGLSTALKVGIDACATPYVGYMDADLQTAPEDFDLLWPYAAEYEIVTGIRANRQDTAFKKLQSRIGNGIRNHFTHDGVTDTGCPLKILHTDVAKRIPFFTGMHRFLPALVLLQGGQVKQVPVRHFPRVSGKSKYHLSNRLWGPLHDCYAYRWMRKRYINYSIKEGTY